MIVYRVFRFENKFLVKLVHFGLQFVAFCTAVLGLKAVFDFHNTQKIPNMYSLHSWLGMSTVVLFSCQVHDDILICTVRIENHAVGNQEYFGNSLSFVEQSETTL